MLEKRVAGIVAFELFAFFIQAAHSVHVCVCNDLGVARSRMRNKREHDARMLLYASRKSEGTKYRVQRGCRLSFVFRSMAFTWESEKKL